MTQVDCTQAASDRKPLVTLHDSATTCDDSTAGSCFDPGSAVLLCALTKCGLRCCLAVGNAPAITPGQDVRIHIRTHL